jgi:hypothetical protein
MSTRLIRDWTASDKINLLSVQAERFFVRLIMKADDYGCFYANPKLLKPILFPLLLESLREADISRWIAECEKAGLIVLYEADSKPYLEIKDFNQRLRAKNRKFPERQSHDGHMTVTRQHEEKRREEEEKEENTGAPDLSGSNLFRKPNIPTTDQVLETFIRAGGTKEMAKSFYEKYEATGWYLHGSPVVSYAALAQRFIQNWKDVDKKEKDLPPHMVSTGGPKLPKL